MCHYNENAAAAAPVALVCRIQSHAIIHHAYVILYATYRLGERRVFIFTNNYDDDTACDII